MLGGHFKHVNTKLQNSTMKESHIRQNKRRLMVSENHANYIYIHLYVTSFVSAL